jgi:ribosomal-protein-alanine N-acetyltransferase
MAESDICHIAEIERECFSSPWSRDAFLSELKKGYGLNIVMREIDALENECICAYSCNHVIEDELSILRMAVVPGKRRLGIGEQLLDLVLEQATGQGAVKAFLEVRPSNAKASMLYRKLGFRVIGTRPNYYTETGEHALVMMKRLKETS